MIFFVKRTILDKLFFVNIYFQKKCPLRKREGIKDRNLLNRTRQRHRVLHINQELNHSVDVVQ